MAPKPTNTTALACFLGYNAANAQLSFIHTFLFVSTFHPRVVIKLFLSSLERRPLCRTEYTFTTLVPVLETPPA